MKDKMLIAGLAILGIVGLGFAWGGFFSWASMNDEDQQSMQGAMDTMHDLGVKYGFGLSEEDQIALQEARGDMETMHEIMEAYHMGHHGPRLDISEEDQLAIQQARQAGDYDTVHEIMESYVPEEMQQVRELQGQIRDAIASGDTEKADELKSELQELLPEGRGFGRGFGMMGGFGGCHQ